ncbi:MAG: hypothetical protein AB4038_08870, partial [Prochloraceae cyanobacterium]
MANVSSNWQDSLDRGLVNRLTRPLRQPGMMKMAMSQRIINRCDRFLNRLPLLSQQIQRWGNTKTLSSDSVPIVYAQPISLAKEQGIGIGETVSKNHSSISIIQRKIDSPSPSSQDERTTLKPTSIAAENNPVVTSQTISEELTLTSDLPLQAKSIDSLTSPSNQDQTTTL